MTELGNSRRRLPERDLTFFAGAPVCFHCHHFNLFLDQTIDDALGAEEGIAVRTRAAHRASRQLLDGLVAVTDAVTPPERIALAQQVFAAMGHGHPDITSSPTGGSARGAHVHYGFCWHEKYGRHVRRRHPADAFASGFVAAAIEVAHDLPCGSLIGRERDCVAMRANECTFTIEANRGERYGPAIASIFHAERLASDYTPSMGEDEIRAINGGLQAFLAGVGPDSRGLVQGFGVFVTMHLTNYYNEISYRTLDLLRQRAPGSTVVFEALLRESGQVCAFNTFGGILLSPEWEGLVGRPDDDPATIIRHSMGIARALGFGDWSIVEFVPERRLVVRTSTTYEAPYMNAEQCVPDRPSSYFLQGGLCGLMEMAHRAPGLDRPQLDDAFYRGLFKQGARFRVEQTADTARGDRFCEVVVEAGAPR